MLSRGDLVYCDPPYLITTGSYNDGKRGFKDWTLKEERELLALLDDLDRQGILFALSNVFRHKGLTNDVLIEWTFFINSVFSTHYPTTGEEAYAHHIRKIYPYGYPFCFVANQIHQYILVFRKEK